MLTRLTFVNDPAVDRLLGDARDEIRGAVQPGGECIGCEQPLGVDRTLRLDVNAQGPLRIVRVRHATCRPAPTEGPALISLTTYQSHAFAVHSTAGTLPCVLVNPSTDGFVIGVMDEARGQLLAPYWRRGFRRPGSVSIGDRDTAYDAGVAWAPQPDHSIVIEDPLGGTYGVRSTRAFLDLVAQHDGFLFIVSYRHWADDLADDVSALAQVWADPTGAAVVWLPTTCLAPNRPPR